MDHPTAPTISTGPELRALREDAKLTQADVAAAMGVSRTVISTLEGKAWVNPPKAAKYRAAVAKKADS